LPDGLTLDATTGNINGTVAEAGDHPVTFTASNSLGKKSATIDFAIGPNICLTPPLGWNSWNAFHTNISDDKIRAAADAMAATGLIDHGWTYINMDDRWEGQRDASGVIQSSPKFPDMKALTDYIHGKGLKVGIYSSPGPLTCAGAVATYGHEDQDAATYAGWGMDYLKYDWCSYASISEINLASQYGSLLTPDKAAQAKSLALENAVLTMRRYGHDPASLPNLDGLSDMITSTASLTRQQIGARLREINNNLNQIKNSPELSGTFPALQLAEYKAPYAMMRASLDKVDRDIVFSFCQYGMGNVWEWGAQTGGNTWRTTGDIGPTWKSIESHGFGQNGHEPFAAPGHWNDPDMLEIGNGNLTPDENFTHMTLWCMLSAPLLIGCDMPKMSKFIVSLFTNDEVLAVSQDSLGLQGRRAHQDGQTEVWIKPLSDHSMAVAFFNRGDTAADVSVNWSDLKLTGPQTLRDLWRQKDIGVQPTGYTINIAPHGAELFRVQPKS